MKGALFIFAGVVLAVSGQAVAIEQSLEVEVTPEELTLRNGQNFSLTARIRNVTTREENFQVWSCSNQQWMTDSTSVHMNEMPCTRNSLKRITLKPGAAYERELFLSVHVA